MTLCTEATRTLRWLGSEAGKHDLLTLKIDTGAYEVWADGKRLARFNTVGDLGRYLTGWRQAQLASEGDDD